MRFSVRNLPFFCSRRSLDRRASQRQTPSTLRLESLENRELLSLSPGSADFQALSDSFLRDDGNDAAIWVTSLSDVSSPDDGVVTLREAIDYAGTEIGGQTLSSTIRFELGGTIRLSKTLTIGKDVSIDASDVGGVVVDRGGEGQILFLYNGSANDARNVSATGLTLKGGAAPSSSTSYSGAGVYLGAYCNFTAIDCAVVDCVSPGGSGAGVYVKGGALTLIDSTIEKNVSTGKGAGTLNGGGIFVDGGALTATRTTFRGNSANDGGDVYLKGGVATFDGVRFVDSTATTGAGGAIFNASGALSIENSSFVGATAAGLGGAIYDASADDASTSVVDSFFVETSASSGGAVYFYSASAALSGCSFSTCAATERGGAVYADGNVELKIDGGTFADNVASVDGGAIFNAGFLALEKTSFNGNEATKRGGAILSSGYFEIRDAEFASGGANEGGAIYVESDATGVYAETTSWLLRSTATDSTATLGGAIYNAGLLSVAESTFASNAATSGGGAIYNEGAFFADATQIVDNAAQSVGGGVLNAVGGSFAAERSTISRNAARSQNGGGFANFGTASLDATLLCENVAAELGGAFFNAGTLTVRYSTLSENEARSGGGVSNALVGVATISYSLLSENVARVDGGGAYCVGKTTFASSHIVRNVAATTGAAAYSAAPNSDFKPSFDAKTKIADNVAASSVVPTVLNESVVLSDVATERVLGGAFDFGVFPVSSTTAATRTFALFNAGSDALSFSDFDALFSGLGSDALWAISARRADGATIALDSSATFEVASGETIYLAISVAKPTVSGAKRVELSWTTQKIGANGKPIGASKSVVAVAADARVVAKASATLATTDATLSFGETGELTVALKTKPASNVVVYLSASDGAKLSTDVLAFSPTDYAKAQRVQISLTPDALLASETTYFNKIFVSAQIESTAGVWFGKTLAPLEFQIDAASAANVRIDGGTIDVETTIPTATPNVVRLAATARNAAISSWRVNWGDGSPLSVLNELATTANFAHYYERSGEYRIVAEFVDERGVGSGVWVEIGSAKIVANAADDALFEEFALLDQNDSAEDNGKFDFSVELGEAEETVDALSAAILAENAKRGR